MERVPPACVGARHLANSTERLGAVRSPRHRHATDHALLQIWDTEQGAKTLLFHLFSLLLDQRIRNIMS